MDAKCDRSPISKYHAKQKLGETRKMIKRMISPGLLPGRSRRTKQPEQIHPSRVQRVQVMVSRATESKVPIWHVKSVVD